MVKASGGRGYHHGDARSALLGAAGELLEATGAAALSLRAVAERAALSRQAPYNHFADKEAMLAELVTAGFQRLAGEIRMATQALSGLPSLTAAAEAYIGFAQTTPALFRLMFSREIVDQSKFPDATRAGDGAYAALVEVVATVHESESVDDLSLAAWCLVHGYATLCIETGIEPPSQRKERARLFAQIIAG